MSTAGQKEVLGAVEIVVGEILNYYSYNTAGNWLVQIGIETMVAGGIQELANLLAPSPLPAAQNGIVRSTVAAQQIIYGQVKAGGVVIFSDSYSTNNQFLDVAVAHSLTRANGSAGMSVQGVQGFYINDVFIPVNTGSGGWNSGSGTITSSGGGQPYDVFAGNLSIFFHDGSQTAADSELTSNFTYWKSTAVGKGVCYSVFKMFNSSNQATFQAAFPQGIPNMLGVVLSGQKVYDPRLDSTNGGSGSQRLATPSTWTYSSNPSLIAADYLLRPKADGGCGFAGAVINWASVAAAANICDQNVTVPAYGATWSGSAWSSTVVQAQYTCNMGLDTSQDCDQNLRSILDCMAGVCVVATGQLYLYAGAPTSSSGSFDETFLAGDIQLTNESPRQSRWNAVKATYGQDPTCDFQRQEAVPYFNSSYITADGGVTLLKSITLPGVNNQFTAQYLEIIETQRSRNKQVLTAKCNLKMLQYQAFDVVSVTIAEYGLSSAPFRILSLTLNSDLSVSVIMQQELSGTYTVSLSQYSEFDPPNLALLGVSPGAPSAPTTLAVNAIVGGNLLTWVPPSPNYYEYIEVQWAPDVSGSPGTWTDLANVVGNSYLDTTNSLTNGTKIWYQVRAVNAWFQVSPWSSSVSITALSMELDNVNDGTTYARPRGNTLQSGVPIITATTGKNACPNPGFEQNLSGVTTVNVDAVTGITAGTPIIDGWFIRQNDNNTFRFGINQNTTFAHGGDFSLSIFLPKGTSVPAHTQYFGEATTPYIAVLAGQIISCGAYAAWYQDASSAFPSGLTGFVDTTILFYDGNHTFLSQVQASLNITVPGVGAVNWFNQAINATVPAGAAFAQLVVYSSVNNTTGGTLSVSATHDSMAVVFDDCYFVVGDPTVAGNGVQLGDQRNIPMYLPGGYATVRNVQALTAHAGGAVDMNAHSATLGNNLTTNYNLVSSAVTGLATGNTYFIAANDPTYAGGSPPVGAFSSAFVAQNSNYAYQLGSVTIPSSGTSGGGGTGACVAADAWLGPTLRARDARHGDIVRNRDGELPIENEPRIVQAPCVRIVSADGAELVCSADTPFTQPDDSTVFAKDMFSHQVWTRRGWTDVADVRNAGMQDVVVISIGGRSFFAGMDQDQMMESHNTVKQ